MTTFGRRVNGLRSLLGLSQRQFCISIGLNSRSTFSNWISGTQRADLPTAEAIADRWLISLDSLYARPGTTGLEPAPALRNAQRNLGRRLIDMGQVDGTPTSRTVLCYQILVGELKATSPPLLPELSLSAWCQWLRLDPGEWDQSVGGDVSLGPPQLAGASFFLGWYERCDAWRRWLEFGSPTHLQFYTPTVPSPHTSQREDAVMIQLGQRLRDLRAERQISQSELAKHLGLDNTTISSYERNITLPYCDMLVRIALFFNVTTDYLLGVTTDHPNAPGAPEPRLPSEWEQVVREADADGLTPDDLRRALRAAKVFMDWDGQPSQ